jgi:hypothetical protein
VLVLVKVKHQWGTHLLFVCVCGGGGIRPHTGGLQTTKKWEVDEHVKGRLNADGRVRRQKKHCRLCLLNDTTPHELHCLFNDNVNVHQRPNRVWYTQAHDSAERAVGFVSNNHGEERRDKRVPVLRLTRPLTKRACPLRLVYGADRSCVFRQH